jgi:hypothetical protein
MVGISLDYGLHQNSRVLGLIDRLAITGLRFRRRVN